MILFLMVALTVAVLESKPVVDNNQHKGTSLNQLHCEAFT